MNTGIERRKEMTEKNYGDEVNFDFDLGRENLYIANGEDTGSDAIIRMDTGKPISIVSRSYQTVAHKDANAFAEKLFEKNGINYEEGHVSVSAGGARFFREFRFTDMSFTPSIKGDLSTALDGKGEVDSYFPSVILRNSCDKSCGFDFIFGAYRFVCSNGLILGKDIAKITTRHVVKPDYEIIGNQLLEKIEASIEGFRAIYSNLNSTNANPYLQMMVAQNMINNTIAKTMVDMSGGLIQAEFEDEGKLSNIEIAESASAYLLYNIMTEIATHRSRKYNKALQMQQKLAKIFV